MRVAVVKAAHDDEAGVCYVEHSDVEGLHIEEETFDAFRRNVADAVADLAEGESHSNPCASRFESQPAPKRA